VHPALQIHHGVAVSTVTRLTVVHIENQGSIPDRGKDISLFQYVHTDSASKSVSCLMGPGWELPGTR
jgi:hypothetical protein